MSAIAQTHMVDFDITLKRSYTFRGKERSFINAKLPGAAGIHRRPRVSFGEHARSARGYSAR